MSQDVESPVVSKFQRVEVASPPSHQPTGLLPQSAPAPLALTGLDLDHPDSLEDQTTLEVHADSLMDGLFGDVEEALEGRITLVRTPDSQGQITLQPSVALAARVPPPSESLLDKLDKLEVEVSETTLLPSPDPGGRGWSLNSLLLGAAFTSGLMAAVLGLATQTRLLPPTPPSPPGPSLSDSQFTERFQHLLDLLDRRQRRAANATPSAQPVYVPIYPPPPVPVLPPPPPPPLPSSPPTLVVPPADSSLSPTTLPTSAYSLIGVLELSDRAVALVSQNGSVQRVRVGESIGNGDWTLVAIQDQRAVLRGRNRSLRSVAVGERF